MRGLVFYAKRDYGELPYNLSFSDTLAEIFQKMGNPDSYSKNQIVYKINRNYYGLTEEEKSADILKDFYKADILSSNAEVKDTVIIDMESGKITSIMIAQNLAFNISYK